MNKTLELFEGLKIEVYDDGRIFSLNNDSIRSNGKKDGRKGREIKQRIDRYGYANVTFSKNGIRKTYLVHRLVAIAFIDNPLGKKTVNHINGDKLDNRVKNLEWATHKEQKTHAIENGLCKENIKALDKHNRSISRPVLFRGKEYKSINEARRETGIHQRVIVREGKWL